WNEGVGRGMRNIHQLPMLALGTEQSSVLGGFSSSTTTCRRAWQHRRAASALLTIFAARLRSMSRSNARRPCPSFSILLCDVCGRGFHMPSLFRFLTLIGVLGGLTYGAMFMLATWFDPKPREITVSIPPDRFAKQP